MGDWLEFGCWCEMDSKHIVHYYSAGVMTSVVQIDGGFGMRSRLKHIFQKTITRFN